MKKKYHYKVVDVSTLPLAQLESSFDALGAEGYEMVGVIPRNGVSRAVFKREEAVSVPAEEEASAPAAEAVKAASKPKKQVEKPSTESSKPAEK